VDRKTRLGLLASAILDGTPVDWPSAQQADPRDQAVVRQLQLLAEIAALHQSEPREPAPATAAMAGAPLPLVTWGHLQLGELIGTGAFGEVYRAWDLHLHREVALKLLRSRRGDDGSLSVGDPGRVVHEGRLLARVRHPNVITVYGAEPRDGTIGIWMEFIAGRTLHRLVDEQGPLGAREVVALGVDLCRALAAVHQAGLLHRDISARNVMREQGGRVVLMDFGAGYDAPGPGHDAAAAGMTGTPPYMAPELFAGRPAEVRTDIYALGALLFYVASAEFPVGGRTLAELRTAHEVGTRRRLRDLRSDLPPGLVTVIERATAADPALRYASAGALENALQDSLDDPVREPDTRPAPRRRWLVAAAVAAAAAAIGLNTLWRSAAGPAPPSTTAAPAAMLTDRRLDPPPQVWLFSNPSADGRMVAAQVTDTGDVALVDLTTGTFRPLGLSAQAPPGGYASSAALAPDGRAVAVEWAADDGGSLWVVPTDGLPVRQVGKWPAVVHQWSADGAFVLVTIVRGREHELALIALSDGGVRALHRGPVPPERASLSADGRFVVFDAPPSTATVDHDLMIVDVHTGQEWSLVAGPSHDTLPLWSPDGRTIVFVSDRSREPSLWGIKMSFGRAAGPPELLRDDVGRIYPYGFTASGTLFYQRFAGFAAIHTAGIAPSPTAPAELSARQALSNFYPVWAPDGRALAFTSERTLIGRELWLRDLASGRDVRVPAPARVGRVHAWSPDSRWLLVSGYNNARRHRVDRVTGQMDEVAVAVEGRSAWTSAGIVYRTGDRVIVAAPDGTIRRTLTRLADASAGFGLADDGESVLDAAAGATLTLRHTASSRTLQWQQPGLTAIAEHLTAAGGAGAVYVARQTDGSAETQLLMWWPGEGAPRELLRARGPEAFRLVGWGEDRRDVVVIRRRIDDDSTRRQETVWRVPLDGSPPISSGISLVGLRDASMHPDGRRIAFNAGWKQVEHWTMEHVLH
jgi:hypothetical protein